MSVGYAQHAVKSLFNPSNCKLLCTQQAKSLRQYVMLRSLHSSDMPVSVALPAERVVVKSEPIDPVYSFQNVQGALAQRSFCELKSPKSVLSSTAISDARPNTAHRAYVAFGSNMGDRLELIEQACQALEREEHIVLKRTSGIWETKPMYYANQDSFLNGVCEVGG